MRHFLLATRLFKGVSYPRRGLAGGSGALGVNGLACYMLSGQCSPA